MSTLYTQGRAEALVKLGFMASLGRMAASPVARAVGGHMAKHVLPGAAVGAAMGGITGGSDSTLANMGHGALAGGLLGGAVGAGRLMKRPNLQLGAGSSAGTGLAKISSLSPEALRVLRSAGLGAGAGGVLGGIGGAAFGDEPSDVGGAALGGALGGAAGGAVKALLTRPGLAALPARTQYPQLAASSGAELLPLQAR